MAVIRSGVTVLRGKQSLEDVADMLRLLGANEVLVGFPDDGTYRREDSGETDDYGKPIKSVEGSDITNAALAYIHDNGMPEQNIPQREFMRPGIKDAEDKITRKLSQVATAVVQRGAGAVVIEQGLVQVGLIAKLAIQNKINEGVPPPLAKSTLVARARKGRKGAGLELLSREKGYEPSMDFAKPLVDTAQMRNAVNFVIRPRKKRKK